MRPLVWVMKKRAISSQQIGFSILILIILMGWGIKSLSSAKKFHNTSGLENGIFIQIKGEIKTPGVYVFDRSPSLKDLISIAGGLIPGQWSKELDKYPSLVHGASVQITSENGYLKVYTGSMPASYKVTLKIPIPINTANQEELDAIPNIKCLPSVGKILYKKIKPYIGV
jgi:DNA uptake protein ComE-like DNA-binding protein